jgi:hypothetical protein
MSENEQYLRAMTATRVIENSAGAEVVFLESAQFYRLPKENPAFDSLVAMLQKSTEEGGTVNVRTTSITSNIIEDIKPVR